MKILLLGASGQVGREILAASQHEVIPYTRSDLDLADYDGNPDILTKSGVPDVVINAAAWTHVDNCEDDEPLACQINGTAIGHLQKACDTIGSRLVHYSSDYVFAGTSAMPYKESDAPSPIGAYGRSKLAGEQACLQGENNLLIRTSWVHSPYGKNFIKTIIDLAQNQEELNIVSDQMGTPTSARLIATGTIALLENNAKGIFHLTPRGYTTWHGFACLIVRELESYGLPVKQIPVKQIPLKQIPLKVKTINAVSSADYPTKAVRPAYSVLDNGKLRQFLGGGSGGSGGSGGLPDWQEDVKDTIRLLCEAQHDKA